MKPPSEVENPHKPARPTDVEQLGMIVFVPAVAVANVATTALGRALARFDPIYCHQPCCEGGRCK